MNLSEQLCAVARTLRCNFTIQEQAISAERVFADSGLLPSIMRRADQLSTFCLGYDLGLTYVDQNDALLGIKVEMNDKVSNTLRLMCALDVIIELMQNGPTRNQTPLDALLSE